MPRQELLDILKKCDQLHLCEGMENLSDGEIKRFTGQIAPFSYELLRSQREAFFSVKPPVSCDPWIHLGQETSPSFEQGRDLLCEGKAASVILAGGQGSRLGWAGPKALYPIFPEKNLTLLQILLEKVRIASEKFKAALPVAIMASPFNHAMIETYVKGHDYCGLLPDQITIFSQTCLPLLDESGNWFLEAPGKLAIGSDGNGGVFKRLEQCRILEQWKKQGIETITILPIDNPLAQPFDLRLIDHHTKMHCDVSCKCITRGDPEEKVGLFAQRNGKLCVVEYSELTHEQKTARREDNSFVWPYANIGQFSFSLPFAKKIAQHLLPWHMAKKKSTAWKKGEITITKYETYLFDLLPLADHAEMLLYSREDTYAPLKNKEGAESPDDVRRALTTKRDF